MFVLMCAIMVDRPDPDTPVSTESKASRERSPSLSKTRIAPKHAGPFRHARCNNVSPKHEACNTFIVSWENSNERVWAKGRAGGRYGGISVQVKEGADNKRFVPIHSNHKRCESRSVDSIDFATEEIQRPNYQTHCLPFHNPTTVSPSHSEKFLLCSHQLRHHERILSSPNMKQTVSSHL